MLLRHRETTPFDPNKKEHRAAVHAFMRRRAWSDSPLVFAYDPKFGSIAEQVQTKLLLWYIAQDQRKVGGRSKQLKLEI